MNDERIIMAKRISSLLVAQKAKAADLARFCGVTDSAVGKWVTGQASPKGDNLNKVANFFGVTKSFLRGETSDDDRVADALSNIISVGRGRSVMVISQSDAYDYVSGKPVKHSGHVVTYFECSSSSFAIDISDKANHPLFNKGDRVVIDPTLKPEPGDMVMAYLVKDKLVIFRRFRIGGLAPLNTDYIPADSKPIVDYELIGVMTEHARGRAS